MKHTYDEILKNNYDGALKHRSHSADYVFEIKVPKGQSDKFVDAGSKNRDIFVYLNEDFPLQDKFSFKAFKFPTSGKKPSILYSYVPNSKGHILKFKGQKTKRKIRSKKNGKSIGIRSRQSNVTQKYEEGYLYNTVKTKEKTVQVSKYKDPKRKTKRTTTSDGTKTEIELTEASKAGISAGIQSLSRGTINMILNKGEFSLGDWFKECVPNAIKEGVYGLIVGGIMSKMDQIPLIGPVLRIVLCASNLIEKYYNGGKVDLAKEIATMMVEIGITIAVASVPGIGWIGAAVLKGVGFSIWDSACSFLW